MQVNAHILGYNNNPFEFEDEDMLEKKNQSEDIKCILWPDAVREFVASNYIYGFAGYGYPTYYSAYTALYRMKKNGEIEGTIDITMQDNKVVLYKDGCITKNKERSVALKQLLEQFSASGETLWTLDSILDAPFEKEDVASLHYYKLKVLGLSRISILYDKQERTVTLVRR